MNCTICYIGLVDKTGKTHAVEFKEGLNVVTGKSSTGKSALIEIFDYCFGSSDYTIPEGVITDSAKIYFTIFKFPKSYLVLARTPNSNKGFVKEIDQLVLWDKLPVFEEDFFAPKLFLPLSSFNKEVGRYFGLNITDVDEDLVAKEARGQKSPSPSIRSFTSFMLQHQNLVANKHAIFYRFDEKEKREQAIEHLKIFLGFVDQDYFLISQKINLAQTKLRRLEYILPKREQEKLNAIHYLDGLLEHFASITGKKFFDVPSHTILINPSHWLEIAKVLRIDFDTHSDEFSRQLRRAEQKFSVLMSEVRILERKRDNIRASIIFSKRFSDNILDLHYPTSIKEVTSQCPFCASNAPVIEAEANRLVHAVDWLNDQLEHSPYMAATFEKDENDINNQIDEKRDDARRAESEILKLRTSVDEIQERQSVYDLALKAKLQIENYLEIIIGDAGDDIDSQVKLLEDEIEGLNKNLKRYKLSAKIKNAEEFLSKTMNTIGQNLDFEKSYQPVNLEFSLDTFDLWNNKGEKKVFLRSMGSGANWLYSHLCLFLSFQKLFCITDGCKVPPILFLDQPTQVYFPNTSADSGEEFDVTKTIKEDRKAHVDDDMFAVENFFVRIIDFCASTYEETGKRMQIIVTDHADHLKLGANLNFEDYVRARWRSHGFVH